MASIFECKLLDPKTHFASSKKAIETVSRNALTNFMG